MLKAIKNSGSVLKTQEKLRTRYNSHLFLIRVKNDNFQNMLIMNWIDSSAILWQRISSLIVTSISLHFRVKKCSSRNERQSINFNLSLILHHIWQSIWRYIFVWSFWFCKLQFTAFSNLKQVKTPEVNRRILLRHGLPAIQSAEKFRTIYREGRQLVA